MKSEKIRVIPFKTDEQTFKFIKPCPCPFRTKPIFIYLCVEKSFASSFNFLMSTLFSAGRVGKNEHRITNFQKRRRFCPPFSVDEEMAEDFFFNKLGRRTDAVNTGTAFDKSGLNKYGYNDRNEVIFSKRYNGDNPDAPGTAVTAENRAYEYDPIGNRKTSTGWNDAANVQQLLIYESNVLNQYTAVKENETTTASPTYDCSERVDG